MDHNIPGLIVLCLDIYLLPQAQSAEHTSCPSIYPCDSQSSSGFLTRFFVKWVCSTLLPRKSKEGQPRMEPKFTEIYGATCQLPPWALEILQRKHQLYFWWSRCHHFDLAVNSQNSCLQEPCGTYTVFFCCRQKPKKVSLELPIISYIHFNSCFVINYMRADNVLSGDCSSFPKVCEVWVTTQLMYDICWVLTCFSCRF